MELTGSCSEKWIGFVGCLVVANGLEIVFVCDFWSVGKFTVWGGRPFFGSIG